MPTELPSDRHLKPEGLAEYVTAGVPSLVPIKGEPEAFLVVDPPSHIGIRLKDSGGEVDTTAYKHISLRRVVQSGERWTELDVTNPNMFPEAYPLLCAVVDRVQLQGLAVDRAVSEVLATYQQLLAKPPRMAQTTELGLFGELLVLSHLLRNVGEEGTVKAWRGPDEEEHDFGFDKDDVEVKTTLSESRSHWINSTKQLEPTGDRTLWLLSIQLTGAGSGGKTLSDLISSIRARLSSPISIESFSARLESAGWKEDQKHLYADRFNLRSIPLTFRITEDFPAITSSFLTQLGTQENRILKLAYLVDLTGLPAHQAPVPLSDLDTLGVPNE